MWDDLMIFDILSREESILFIFDHSRLFEVALFSSESSIQDIVTTLQFRYCQYYIRA